MFVLYATWCTNQRQEEQFHKTENEEIVFEVLKQAEEHLRLCSARLLSDGRPYSSYIECGQIVEER